MFQKRYTNFLSNISAYDTAVLNTVYKYNMLAAKKQLLSNEKTDKIKNSTEATTGKPWYGAKQFFFEHGIKAGISVATLAVFVTVLFLSIGFLDGKKLMKGTTYGNSSIAGRKNSETSINSNGSEVSESSSENSSEVSQNSPASSNNSSKSSRNSETAGGSASKEDTGGNTGGEGTTDGPYNPYPEMESGFKNVYYTNDPGISIKFYRDNGGIFPYPAGGQVFTERIPDVQFDIFIDKQADADERTYTPIDYIKSGNNKDIINYVVDRARIQYKYYCITTVNGLSPVSGTIGYVTYKDDWIVARYGSSASITQGAAETSKYLVYNYYKTLGKFNTYHPSEAQKERNEFFNLMLKESEDIKIVINIEKLKESYNGYTKYTP